MPDQNVDVTVDSSTTPPTFTFSPPSVTMTAAGKVILHRKPTQAAWTFVGGNVKNDTLGNFTTNVAGDGKTLTFNDALKDTVRTTYNYNVTILLNGSNVTSPDPDIVNDPGQ